MWQGGHAGVGLGGMTKFVLLVVASAAVILSKFSLSTLVACIQAPYTAAFLGLFRFLEIPYMRTYFQELWH